MYQQTYSNRMAGKYIDSKHSILAILLRCFISVFVVYLIFTPIFFIYNLNGFHWIFIIANIIQMFAILWIGVFYRRKNSSIRNKKLSVLFCVLIGLSILLHLVGIPQTVYGVLTATLGIYDRFADNLFFIVLLERLFDNYLITSFLICSTIVFFEPWKKGNA